VRDLVEDGAADLCGVVQSGQRRAQPDESVVVPTHARPSLGGVELHAPVVQVVLVQQPRRLVVRLLKIHGCHRRRDVADTIEADGRVPLCRTW
jgi:hypothetical protein